MHEKYQEQPTLRSQKRLHFPVAVLLPLLCPPQVLQQPLVLEEEGNRVPKGLSHS